MKPHQSQYKGGSYPDSNGTQLFITSIINGKQLMPGQADRIGDE